MHLGHKRHELLACDRLAEQIALDLVARMCAQEFFLSLGLHALGNNVQVQCFAKRNDRLGDSPIVGIVIDVPNKRSIDFEGIDGKLLDQ